MRQDKDVAVSVKSLLQPDSDALVFEVSKSANELTKTDIEIYDLKIIEQQQLEITKKISKLSTQIIALNFIAATSIVR